jgi:hypothetical protein
MNILYEKGGRTMTERNLCVSLLSAIMLSGLINLIARCMTVGEREPCVSREPDFSGGEAAYELIDLLHKEVYKSYRLRRLGRP